MKAHQREFFVQKVISLPTWPWLKTIQCLDFSDLFQCLCPVNNKNSSQLIKFSSCPVLQSPFDWLPPYLALLIALSSWLTSTIPSLSPTPPLSILPRLLPLPRSLTPLPSERRLIYQRGPAPAGHLPGYQLPPSSYDILGWQGSRGGGNFIELFVVR